MGYVLLRSMKVQVAPGKVELRKAGAPCPEAADWPNLGVWIRRGYIVDDGATEAPPQYDRSKLKPSRKAKAEDAKRGANTPNAGGEKKEAKPKPEPEPEPAEESPLSELMALSRSDLNSLATEHGIEEAARFANKEAVAKAIIEAQG